MFVNLYEFGETRYLLSQEHISGHDLLIAERFNEIRPSDVTLKTLYHLLLPPSLAADTLFPTNNVFAPKRLSTLIDP
jgi:hypothetical protein